MKLRKLSDLPISFVDEPPNHSNFGNPEVLVKWQIIPPKKHSHKTKKILPNPESIIVSRFALNIYGRRIFVFPFKTRKYYLVKLLRNNKIIGMSVQKEKAMEGAKLFLERVFERAAVSGIGAAGNAFLEEFKVYYQKLKGQTFWTLDGVLFMVRYIETFQSHANPAKYTTLLLGYYEGSCQLRHELLSNLMIPY